MLANTIIEDRAKRSGKSKIKEKVERAPLAPKYVLLLPLPIKKLFRASKKAL